jgi:hypothetical protein
MARKPYSSGALLLCLLISAAPLSGLEKTIELGKDALWADMMSLDGVTPLPGRWGFQDLTLSGGAYAADSATELLLHFDARASADATGAYTFLGDGPVLSAFQPAIGAASAAFTGARPGLALQGASGSMFSAGAAWGDFAIEFWLSPANLADAEEVLSWAGTDRAPAGSGSAAGGGAAGGGTAGSGAAGSAAGGGVPGGLLDQSIRCFIRDRRLVWDFANLFRLPGTERIPVRLAGTRQLLPRAWHHHLLRFDSREGLLEYLIDGVPEAVAHVTDTGWEAGSVAVPVLGTAHSGPLVIGAGFTGFLDELRISRRAVDDPVLSRFLGKTGVAVSRILDLGYSSTRVIRIETVDSTPADSGIEFSYQAADTWGGRKLLKSDTDWVPFRPGTDFGNTVKARYIQLRVELYPDGTRTQSPRLSSLRVVYEPNLPPAPPAGVAVTPGNGKVTLTWRKVNDLDVKGYLVFYGKSPRNYLGTDSAKGPSPVDAGSATTIEIGGLENGSLYYFAIAAYDDSQPRQQSAFSAEVSARPSRIYPESGQ